MSLDTCCIYVWLSELSIKLSCYRDLIPRLVWVYQNCSPTSWQESAGFSFIAEINHFLVRFGTGRDVNCGGVLLHAPRGGLFSDLHFYLFGSTDFIFIQSLR